MRWNTIQLQRGGMLLMVATSRHHGMPALPDSRDQLQGALFNLWTPDPGTATTSPTPRTWPPPPPTRGPGRCWGFVQLEVPQLGPCVVGGEGGGWEGGVVGSWGVLADAPEAVPAAPLTCPYHPTSLARSAPATDLAVIEIAKHSVPFLNWPFESEIHGTVNVTYFCCFLLVTWCHCVLLSCYLRPK